MFLIDEPDYLPAEFDTDLRQALDIAYVAERDSAAHRSPRRPNMLLKLVRRPGDLCLAVRIVPLLTGGNTPDVVDALDVRDSPLGPGERHVGTIAIADFWVPPPDLGRSLIDGDDQGVSGRVFAGVMVDRWSFMLTERLDEASPTCCVAEPAQFGLFVTELADAVARFNDRCSATGGG